MARSPTSSLFGQPSGVGQSVLVAELQGLQGAHDLVDTAADLLRVVDYQAYDALRVDKEDGSDRVAGLSGVDHSQSHGHIAVVRDDGERDLDPDVLLDPLHPLDVGEDLVDGQTDQDGVHLLELLGPLGEGHELGGAGGGEVSGVAEQDQPLASTSLGRLMGPWVVVTTMSGNLSPIRGKPIIESSMSSHIVYHWKEYGAADYLTLVGFK